MATPLRALPRNTRRAELAQRVGQRAQPRQLSLATAQGPRHKSTTSTPTPPPAVVRARSNGESSRDDLDAAGLTLVDVAVAPPPILPRVVLLAFAVIGLFTLVGLYRTRAGTPIFSSASSLLTLRPLSTPREPFFDGLLGEPARAALDRDIETNAHGLVALRREGHVPVPGGILVFPSSFTPRVGEPYDLVIHFHGNTAVVKESLEVAKIDAALVIVNLGIGSAPYEEYYGVPGTYEELLDAVDAGLARRGVPNPKLGRVALSAWSAGYGSIATIQSVRRGRDDLDAVLIFDGIHAGWEGGALNPRQMKPFVDLAKRAANGGDVYFGMTHSAIDPVAYASTEATAKHLVKQVGATMVDKDPTLDAPTYVRLESMKGAVSTKLEKRMEPTNEARKLAFHVLGYEGETKEHHMAHLFQMSATLLPELRERWAR